MRLPSAMQMVSRANIVLVLAVLVAGCGGGGGGGDGGKLSWPPYTPPADVMSAEEQWRYVAEDLYDLPEDIMWPRPDVDEEVVSRVSWTSFTVEGFLEYITGQPSPEGVRAASTRIGGRLALPRLVARCAAKSLGGRSVAPSQAASTPINWTDEVTGVTWTGTKTETATSWSLKATGKSSEGTNISLEISVSGTQGRASGTYRVRGVSYEEVWVWDPEEHRRQMPGRRNLDISGSISVSGGEDTFNYQGQFNGWGKEEVEEGTGEGRRWVTAEQFEGSVSYSGSFTKDRENLKYILDYREGFRVAQGLFWMKVKEVWDMTLDTEGDPVAGSLTWDGSTSSGVTGHVKVDVSRNSVTGWIKAASGEVVGTIGGTPCEAYITWKATGQRETLWSYCGYTPLGAGKGL